MKTKSITEYRSNIQFLIIGMPGSGKTYSLLTLPRPLLIIDVEGGLSSLINSGKDLTGIDFTTATDFHELDEIIKDKEIENFKSVAIDTYSALQSFHLMKKYLNYSRETLPYSEWNFILQNLKNIFYQMRKRELIFVVNVHEKVDNAKLTPLLQGQSASEIFVYVDFVFRALYMKEHGYLWKIKGENEPLKYRGKPFKKDIEYIPQDYNRLIEYIRGGGNDTEMD